MTEAPLRLRGRADHDQRGGNLLRGLGNAAPELARSGPDDLTACADAVALGEGAFARELRSKRLLLVVEVCIEWQLPLDVKRRKQQHARAPVRGEPAGELESVARVLRFEQWNDDHPLPAGETPGVLSEAPAANVRRPARKEAAKPIHASTVGRGLSAATQDGRAGSQGCLKM